MAKSVRLRPLTGRERRILRAKLGDLSLAVRIHQRYRIIDEVPKGSERAGRRRSRRLPLHDRVRPGSGGSMPVGYQLRAARVDSGASATTKATQGGD